MFWLWDFTLVSSIFVVSLSSVTPTSCCSSPSRSSSLISVSDNIVFPDFFLAVYRLVLFLFSRG